MNGIDTWRLSDDLTVVQASLLILGYDPSILQDKVEKFNFNPPDGYVAVKQALVGAIKTDLLPYTKDGDYDPQFGEFHVVEDLSLIKVEDIRNWLRSKGFGRHFFFFPEGIAGEFANPNHPRYSAKLSAAIEAWNAMEGDALKGKTPKQALKKWLRLEALRFNLTDDEGKPIETAIEEIAKVVNWKTGGGAPSSGSGEPKADKKILGSAFSKLEVLSEKLHKHSPATNFDLDAEIPF